MTSTTTKNSAEAAFDKRQPTITFDDAGLILGAGTALVRLQDDAFGLRRLAIEADAPRCLALLSVAFGKPIPIDVLGHLKAAIKHWQRGDTALAHIRLAFADLPRFDGSCNVQRLALAEQLLDGGLPPRTLMKELGLDTGHLDLLKAFDPEQPRVPAGRGRASGQWTSGTSGSTDSATATASSRGSASEAGSYSYPTPKSAPTTAASIIALPGAFAEGADLATRAGTFASGLFEAATGSELLAGLAAFGAATIVATGGAAAVFGAIFIPSPNNVVSEGAVPGDPSLRYSLNGEDGTLRFIQNGDKLIAVAQLGRDGIFYETKTGIPVARAVGGMVVLDAASLASIPAQAPARTDANTQADAETTSDDPQLCPAPAKDRPHYATEDAVAYEMQINALNNPQRLLPEGWTVSLVNPATGKRVFYDDCRESDGTMIDAKGPGYANMLQSSFFRDFILPDRWTYQAHQQVSAAVGRDVDWFFAEESAAERARYVFSRSDALKNIHVYHVPAIVK